jgi:hypothetical protein
MDVEIEETKSEKEHHHGTQAIYAGWNESWCEWLFRLISDQWRSCRKYPLRRRRSIRSEDEDADPSSSQKMPIPPIWKNLWANVELTEIRGAICRQYENRNQMPGGGWFKGISRSTLYCRGLNYDALRRNKWAVLAWTLIRSVGCGVDHQSSIDRRGWAAFRRPGASRGKSASCSMKRGQGQTAEIAGWTWFSSIQAKSQIGTAQLWTGVKTKSTED